MLLQTFNTLLNGYRNFGFRTGEHAGLIKYTNLQDWFIVIDVDELIAFYR